MNLINDGDVSVSFDSAAFIKENLTIIADVASGRITLAEARAFNAKAGSALKAAELMIKYGQMSKRGRRANEQ